MSSILLKSLAFDLNGVLLTSGGVLPNFLRDTPASAEYLVNGSLRLLPFASHQPRFSSEGALYLEGESQNLLAFANDLRGASWVRGSSWSVQPDRVPDLSGNYTGDRVSVAQTLGNSDAQTCYQELLLPSGKAYTVAAYIRLGGGRFGPNDKLTVTGGVASVVSAPLATVFNDQLGNYLAVSLTFTTAGTVPATYETDDTERTVRVSLYVENATTFDVAGLQVEPGTIRTSLITNNGNPAKRGSRAGDSLTYPSSPVEGLSSFVIYMNLDSWRGNGALFTAGNVSVAIASGALTATCGATTVTDPDQLPASAKIALRVSAGLERIRLYVNGVLKAQQTATGFVATAGNLAIAGTGVRSFKPIYCFNQDLGDGSISVGQQATGVLYSLFEQDVLLPQISEGNGVISFPSVRVPAYGEATVRMPQIRSAAQVISTVTPGSGKQAQQLGVTISTIVNAAAAQRDSITINRTKFSYTSDATPTATEIATAIAGLINTAPKAEPVTAGTPSGASFTVTSDRAGSPFYISVSENLTLTQLNPNVPDTFSLVVPAAVDFELGLASIYAGYAWVSDVTITAINTGTNTLSVTIFENSDYGRFTAGDTIVQASWQTQIGQNSYFAHHLEDHPDIKIAGKRLRSFTFENLGSEDRIVTPYVKI